MMGPLSNGLPNQTTGLMLHVITRLEVAFPMLKLFDAAFT
jgi:hypothetical protein